MTRRACTVFMWLFVAFAAFFVAWLIIGLTVVHRGWPVLICVPPLVGSVWMADDARRSRTRAFGGKS